MAVDFNIEIRKKQLESLDQFVASSREKVQSILESLGWSVEKIQEEQRLFVKCPHNDCHKVPAEKLEDHTDKCKITSSGYDLQEEFMSESFKLSEESSIKIGTDKKVELLCQAFSQKPYFQTAWNGKDPDPLTYSRLVSTFSSDERLVLYDYCIANTRGPPELPEFDTSTVTKEKGDSSFTKEALMSFERDIKRRSVKYKPIHTNHKNYKEVLREVINSQMQQYNDWLENVSGNRRMYTSENFHKEGYLEDGGESENQEKSQEFVERPYSSISKFSHNSSGSPGIKHGISRTHTDSHFKLDDGVKSHYDKEYNSNFPNQSSKSRYKYTHHDEDSQESNSVSKVSSIDMDSPCENYENIPRTHSRESSIHSSHKYKDKDSRYRESRRHKSRSDRKWKKRDHSSGSSRHSSRSHRSKEDRSHRRLSRDKARKHKDYHRDT
ncbi:uncharacterized protein DDB_G0283697-like [Coccinella septempunctata]|uniref:uncharacterized protein DDB_G0283697-like n=1 Tax=Coccinella septempunctata TaxID=41139 RepID=UPI001D07B13C|nr:uncharacterized protein DDB_G0283697-like [Coccinella septempunctata]